MDDLHVRYEADEEERSRGSLRTPASESPVILETVELTRTFGQVVAADGIDLRITAGERVGVVGPNGAGKTTLLNLITGYIRPQRGRIRYLGRDITGLPPRVITRLGIARSFQIPQLYTGLSVVENVLIALSAREERGLDPWRPLGQDALISEALAILGQFGIRDYADQPVVALPEGGRKLLDIALAFALRPRLLLMDEPTSGVSMRDKFGVMDTLMGVLQSAGVTTLFVEHDMEVIRRYAGRVLVLRQGRIIADGPPEAVLADVAMDRRVF